MVSDNSTTASETFDVVRFAADDFIFRQGDLGDAAYLIRSGKILVRKTLNDGSTERLAEIGRGDVLGELALFDDRPRMASAVAQSDVEAIRISRQEFFERMGTIDPVMKSMILVMVKRARQMADDLMRKKTMTTW